MEGEHPQGVLESAHFIAANSEHVFIQEEAINKTAEEVRASCRTNAVLTVCC